MKLIENDFPILKETAKHIKLRSIYFHDNPGGINILHGCIDHYYTRNEGKLTNSAFRLDGIEVMNKLTNKYDPISLGYFFGSLSEIEIPEPRKILKTYDLNNIRINNLKRKLIKLNNEDKNKVLKIIGFLSPEKLELLELDFSFEIEFEGKKYYTFIDLEDGNYIAVNRSGKVFRLFHDHEEPVDKIANSISDFLIVYDGNKDQLMSDLLEEY